jgi:hypothetical protein
MCQMILRPRTSLMLTVPQYEYLMAEAKRLGISVADLIRRIIDQHRESRT